MASAGARWWAIHWKLLLRFQYFRYPGACSRRRSTSSIHGLAWRSPTLHFWQGLSRQMQGQFPVSKDHGARPPLLAREGWTHIALAVAAAVGVHYFAGAVWAAPLWLLVVFVVQFFRDPARLIPTDAHALVCPADGRVIVVDEVQDPYLKRPARRWGGPGRSMPRWRWPACWSMYSPCCRRCSS